VKKVAIRESLQPAGKYQARTTDRGRRWPLFVDNVLIIGLVRIMEGEVTNGVPARNC
jgi:hypothetical protein